MSTATCLNGLRCGVTFTTRHAASKPTRRCLPIRASQKPIGEPSNERKETVLLSTAAPVITLAASGGLRAALEPQAAYFNTLGLPDWLVHWGHPGNMLVVLLAMGGYGAVYLGWQIRISEDGDVVGMAKDMHPKLSLGMFIFFALGAVGGMLSLVMQDKPIFASPHVWTGLIGLTLLAFQAMLPLFFEEDRSTRTFHAYFGTAIFALFIAHAALGLQLGLSI